MYPWLQTAEASRAVWSRFVPHSGVVNDFELLKVQGCHGAGFLVFILVMGCRCSPATLPVGETGGKSGKGGRIRVVCG